MRILFLSFNQTNKGTYWRAYHLGRQLVKMGHSVTLVSTSRDRRVGFAVSQLDGIRLVESPDFFSGAFRRSGWDPWNTLNRILWLRNQPFDIIHSFESRPTVIFPALVLKRKLGVPLLLDWCDWFGRGGSVEERSNPWVRAILRAPETYFEEHFRNRADGATVICTTLRDKALQLGVPSNRIRLLPNGADTEFLFPMPQSQARRQAGLDGQALVIGYLGSIFPRDASLMAKAFDLVHQRYPQALLAIIGGCQIDIRKLVQVPASVVQTGPLDRQRLLEYLAACDLFWLPMNDTNANRGRLPMKLTDYMAVGRPVVATAVGDLPELFSSAERFGSLSEPAPEAFAQATIQLIQDPLSLEAFGQNARQNAETRFQWSKIALDLLGFYSALVQD